MAVAAVQLLTVFVVVIFVVFAVFVDNVVCLVDCVFHLSDGLRVWLNVFLEVGSLALHRYLCELILIFAVVSVP